MQIISGLFRRRILSTPKGLSTRPTSGALREALFNICRNDVEQCEFLDLFAGSGAVGLEAISRGATSATFIESDREALRCIHKNIEALDVAKQCSVISGDVLRLVEKLSKQGKRYDIIFADPPYQVKTRGAIQMKGFSQLTLEALNEWPLLKPGGRLFIEEAADAVLDVGGLTTLKVVDSRRFSSAMLHQFE